MDANLKAPLVILAGGKGERAGMSKGLIEYNGRPWLEHQMREFRNNGGDKITVVLGHQYHDYLSKIPSLKTENIIVNTEPERGQFSSVQMGLAATHSASAFILPVDVPVCSKRVWQTLVNELTGETQVCLPTWQQKGGHPILLAKTVIDIILRAPANARLDHLIHSLTQTQVKRIEVEDMRVRMNINTLSQWQSLIA